MSLKQLRKLLENKIIKLYLEHNVLKLKNYIARVIMGERMEFASPL